MNFRVTLATLQDSLRPCIVTGWRLKRWYLDNGARTSLALDSQREKNQWSCWKPTQLWKLRPGVPKVKIDGIRNDDFCCLIQGFLWTKDIASSLDWGSGQLLCWLLPSASPHLSQPSSFSYLRKKMITGAWRSSIWVCWGMERRSRTLTFLVLSDKAIQVTILSVPWGWESWFNWWGWAVFSVGKGTWCSLVGGAFMASTLACCCLHVWTYSKNWCVLWL